ncbi:MAG TPA: polysaccharide deacetylase family protein, partial [Micromonosporaceae bacterium]
TPTPGPTSRPSAGPSVAPSQTVAPSPTAGPSDAPPPTRLPSPTRPPFPARLAGQDLTRIPTSQPVVALTFDAGANADAVTSILATLRREQIRATFFLTGDFVQRYPATAAAIAAAGHRIANHSRSHPHFPALTGAGIAAQVAGAEAAIRSATGADAHPWFRFPFGDRDSRTIAAVNDLGYVPVRWTVDTLGWQGTGQGRTAAPVTERVLASAQPGEIVLMHVGSNPGDGSTLDADALPAVIAGLRQRGYRFVTLDFML